MGISKRNRLATFAAFLALILCVAGVLRAAGPSISLGGTLGSSGPNPILAANTVALSGSSPHTLTQAELSSTTLQFTGTTSGTIQVIAPLVAGMLYNVQNATNNSITFGGASGSTITMAPATSTLATCQDGANYIVPLTAPNASVVNLSRTLFVDGSFIGGSPNGSIAAPYQTISAALATIGNPTSANDANSIVQVMVASALGGYTSEPGNTITIPPFRNIQIQAWPLSGGVTGTITLGPTVSANIVWNNTSGGSFAASQAQLQLSGVELTGNITYTDSEEAGSNPGIIALTDTTIVTGNIIATATTHFAGVEMWSGSQVYGNIDTPTTFVTIRESTVSGSITAHQLDRVALATIIGGTTDVSGPISDLPGTLTFSTTYSAPSIVSQQGYYNGCHGTIVGAASFLAGAFVGGTLEAASATLQGDTFSGGFQLTATTVTTDAQSWGSYLAQGGLVNGATVTLQAPAYNPSTPTNWSDAGAPTTEAQALDRIAAALHGLSPPVYP